MIATSEDVQVNGHDRGPDETDVRKLYEKAYGMFEQGDYVEADRLGIECRDRSTKESYWYWGATGLRCWVCNFTNDGEGLKEAAAELLEGCPVAHRPWFVGVAQLNLGLWFARHGDADLAREAFEAAATAYDDYDLDSTQPPSWALVLGYFAAVARWASGAGVDELKHVAEEIHAEADAGECPEGLCTAAGLLLRRARGEAVMSTVAQALVDGVSRAFLAPLLLWCRDERGEL
jgi:hypothetical protein